jgi:hypothetical protein
VPHRTRLRRPPLPLCDSDLNSQTLLYSVLDMQMRTPPSRAFALRLEWKRGTRARSTVLYEASVRGYSSICGACMFGQARDITVCLGSADVESDRALLRRMMWELWRARIMWYHCSCFAPTSPRNSTHTSSYLATNKHPSIPLHRSLSRLGIKRKNK